MWVSTGQSQASTPSLFGAFSTPAFGASSASNPAFGAGSSSAFGFGASTPAFGAASTPAFGAASTGAPSIFGSMPAFGAASSSAFSYAGLPINTLPISLMPEIAFVLHTVVNILHCSSKMWGRQGHDRMHVCPASAMTGASCKRAGMATQCLLSVP